MFVVRKDVMAAGLRAVAKKSCCYIGDRCDCKYGATFRGEQTGCPEASAAARVLEAMTDEEFDAICSRARLIQSSWKPE